MKLPLRLLLFAAVLTLAVASPASAQYMFLDSNGNAVHDAGDQMQLNGTPTNVTIYVDTNHNRDGSVAVCNVDAMLPMSINSWTVLMQAENGTVTYGPLTNLQAAAFPITFPVFNPGTGSFVGGFGSSVYSAEGKYALASLQITGTAGTPRVNLVEGVSGNQESMNFGSQCFGQLGLGSYLFNVDWFDVDGLATAAGATNDPPILTAPSNQTGAENSPLTVNVSATDTDATDVLTISQTSTLPFITAFEHTPSVSPASASLSGTPNFSHAGTYTIDWSVSDGAGGTDDATTTVNIAEINRAPVLGAIGNRTVTLGGTVSFTATATDPDGGTLVFSLGASAPAGALIGGATGAFSWTPTGTGSFPITVNVTDNGSPQLSDSETFNIDVSAPANQTPVLGAIGAKTVAELATLAFTATATDDGVTLTFSLDPGAPAGATINASTGAFSWTPTEAQGPGTFPITVSVADNGTPSLDDSETITVTVTEVNVAPVLGAIGNRTIQVSSLLAFTATATDADLPANALSFSLDAPAPAGAAINATTGAFAWTPGTAQVGTSAITVRVADNGTPSLEDFEEIMVEVTAAPNVAPTLGAIGDKTVNELATLAFTATATDPDVSQVLTFSLDAGAPAGAGINATTGAFSWTPTEAQGPGSFPITVRVTDNGAGNLSDSEAITVTVNELNVAPVVLVSPANRTVAEQTNVAFTATVNDGDIPANTMTFSLRFAPAGATIDAATGAFSWTPTEAQGPGAFAMDVLVTDNGTPPMSSATGISITVTEVNVAPVLVGIGNQAGTVGVPVTFTATATDADIPANTLAFSLDAGAPAGSTINAATGAFSWTPTANGSFPVTVRVRDNGTPALDDFEAITIEVSAAPNLAPVLGAIGDRTVDELATLAFTATATDPNSGDVLTFSLDAGAPAGATIGGTTGAFSWTPTEAQGPGSFPITVRVTDNGTPALNDNETITVTVNEVNVAPALAVIGDKSGTTGVAITFTATTTDADLPANTLTFSLDAGAPAGATINGGTGAFSWTPSATGSFPVTVRVTDNGTPALDDFEAITCNVTEGDVNDPPVLSPIGDSLDTDELTTLAFTATATDPDVGQNLTFSLDAGAPAGATIGGSSGAFSWTPTEAQGPEDYPITVRVTDNGSPALDDFELITVPVNEVNVAPVLAAIGNKSGTTGVAVTFTAAATDADIPANTLAFSLDAGAPAGATINASTGAFSWTPSATGSFPVTVRVTDNGVPALDDFEAITITVTEEDVNDPPVLAAIGSKTVDELVTLTFTATATDPDAGQTLTFSLDAGAPAGATINGSTGAFSWTPAETDGPSSVPITVRVTDNGVPALDDFEAIIVTINGVNSPPVLAPIGDKSGTVGVAITYTATATDSDIAPNTLTFSLDAGAPAGATIGGGTGAFSWTPSAAGAFPVTVRVTDNGVPALDDFEAITITVVDQDANDPPVLAAIGNKTVNEQTTLAFTATATDPDAGQTLAFSLDAPSPAGATINASTGAFSWTPTEAQGPAIIPITVRVTDNGTPALSDFETIAVAILEVNVAPVLAPIGNKSGTVGVAITFTATATDADLPANTLAFSLDAGAPSGATINASTGVFSWTPAATGSFPVTVRVTDDGTPALSDSETITITVNAGQQDFVRANAFFHGHNLLTILESRDPYTCAQIEPVRGSFDIKNVNLGSIVMIYQGNQITAAKAQKDGDQNHNRVKEIRACFAKSDLRRLFDDLPRGFHKVTVEVQGTLTDGRRFRDTAHHFVLVLGFDCFAMKASPNPLNPETVLSFATTRPGPVTVQIFDVRGRLVKSLYNGTMQAGLNEVRWDGKSTTGTRVATGVYFVKTRTVDAELVERVTVLK